MGAVCYPPFRFGSPGIPSIEARSLTSSTALRTPIFSKMRDFRTALLQDPTVSGLLSAKDLDVLLNPEGYIGLSREEVGAVISYVEGLRQSDPTASSHRTQASENRR
jgi:hypothetical protein